MASINNPADTFRPKGLVAVANVLQIQIKKAFRRVVMALREMLGKSKFLTAAA